MGDWLLLLAVPWFVLNLTGSALASGAALAASAVPALVLGPVAGVLADRWDRRRMMIFTDVMRVPAVSLMFLVHDPDQVWIIYLALVAESAFSQLFGPAQRAIVPALVGRGDRLATANSLSALVSGIVRLVGGPLGGAIYALGGFTMVVAIDVGSYLVSALLVTAIHLREGKGSRAAEKRHGKIVRGFLRELRAGVRYIARARGFLALFAAAAMMTIGNATLTALLVPYMGDVLHQDAQVLGWLLGAFGLGFVAGAPLSKAILSRFALRTAFSGSLLTLSALFAAAFNVRDLWAEGVLFALVGASAVCCFVMVDTFIGRYTPDSVLGRVGAAYLMLQATGNLAGMLGGSLLSQVLGIVNTMNLAAAVIAGAGVLALLLPRRLGDQVVEVPGTGAAADPRPVD
jgi:predicted MFS family arabinose efflux permease